jgi:hypothetical protein
MAIDSRELKAEESVPFVAVPTGPVENDLVVLAQSQPECVTLLDSYMTPITTNAKP